MENQFGIKKILVIEDEIHIRETLVDLIQMAGYQVITAENGIQGYMMVIRKNPDLIICDVMMPLMDGYEMLEAVRSNEKTRFLPFIFLTAKSDTEFLRKGMSHGADDYIVKPFDSTDLLQSIKYRLERYHEFEESVKLLEQQRLKMELHDNLQQTLIGAKLITHMMMKKYSSENELIAADLKILQENLELTFLHLRTLLDGNPVDKLQVLGFRNTLIKMASSFERFSGMAMNMLDEWESDINIQTGQFLIPVISEIFTNTIKHAHATEITIHLYRDGATPIIEISDNGIGMDLSVVSGDTNGMRNIRFRLKNIATYNVTSQANKGTRFKISLKPPFS